MYVVSTQIYTELIFFTQASSYFVHGEGYNIQQIFSDTFGQQKTKTKHLFWLPRLVYFYITLIHINEEFIPQWHKKPIDPQPVSKTLVILAENRVLKFLQHSLNLIFFCNHRLFITVLWTVSIRKT